jgi:hypothetical protein
MATTITTKNGRRIVIDANGEKIYIIRGHLQPMTLQIEPTMFSLCKMLFRTQIDKFELLPLSEYGSRYGTWALYLKYRGLHYYLLIRAWRDKNSVDPSFVFKNEPKATFEAVRTNFKIPGLFMMPSELKEPDDEINFRYMTKHGIYGNDRYTDIGEHTTSYWDNIDKIYHQSYSRYEEYVNYHHQREMTTEEKTLFEFITLPYKYFLANEKNSINYDEEYGLIDFHTRLSYKHYFTIIENISICYDAPELVSISKEEFNCIVNVIFNNARKKRMEKYSTLVREISQLNDNCIEYVMQYVF